MLLPDQTTSEFTKALNELKEKDFLKQCIETPQRLPRHLINGSRESTGQKIFIVLLALDISRRDSILVEHLSEVESLIEYLVW